MVDKAQEYGPDFRVLEARRRPGGPPHMSGTEPFVVTVDAVHNARNRLAPRAEAVPEEDGPWSPPGGCRWRHSAVRPPLSC
ncbi:hypothetical protein SGFS_025230 [Streptomyces graminofaciens]|uniref:Uncharacterized protein n=1 Tax=Streptomyces graminofaciens TaxID=68212 RepID=A0ABM7F5X4_9ACTN|nr:hypothetical protein SGFS_025230 [Streptomyces graminofaciens]